MKFSKIKLNQLIQSTYNPRIMNTTELQKLKNNILKFGLVDPIIINTKNNHIIGGHQRYDALTEILSDDTELNLLEIGSIGWVFDNTKCSLKNKDDEKILNLSLNKINGRWNFEKLETVMQDLSKQNYDLNLTGFDDIELKMFDNIQLDDLTTRFNNSEIEDLTSNFNENIEHETIQENHENEQIISEIETPIDNTIKLNFIFNDLEKTKQFIIKTIQTETIPSELYDEQHVTYTLKEIKTEILNEMK